MTQISLKSTCDDLSAAFTRVTQDDERIVLEYQGKPIAALISMRDLELLERLTEELEDRIDRQEIEKALQEPSDPIPYEVFRKELGL